MTTENGRTAGALLDGLPRSEVERVIPTEGLGAIGMTTENGRIAGVVLDWFVAIGSVPARLGPINPCCDSGLTLPADAAAD